MSKSVADYVDEHLAAQENALEAESLEARAERVKATNANNEGSFNNAELAATINPERLQALLQECDSFLALAERNMSDFEDKSIKNMDK